MIRDPRGGHNRKKVNENFFKTWTPQMAYVLGLLLADGAIENTDKSSRTCYIQISSKEKSFLGRIRKTLSSNHKLYLRKPHTSFIRGRKINSGEIYSLRIGNKNMFYDLAEMGLVPKKADRINLPAVPSQLFHHFLRGYFDGDGCVNFYKQRTSRFPRIQVVFTSCCREFLQKISKVIYQTLEIPPRLHWQHYAYRLRYSGNSALPVLEYMYRDTDQAPYLDRKYKIYSNYLKLRQNSSPAV